MPNDRSFRGFQPYRRALTVILVLTVSGCDRDPPEPPPAPVLQADPTAELRQQLETERQEHARTMAVAQAEQVEAAEDFRVVSMILASTGLAMAILVLVLARQRRSRTVFERLLRMLLDRLHRGAVSAGPPAPDKEEDHHA